MEKRTQESQKRKTEELIFDAMFRSNPLNPKERRLGFRDLLKETGMGKATLSRALRRMGPKRENKIKAVTVQEPDGSYKVYYCPAEPEASKIYPFKPTRKHYEKLANEFNARLSAGQYSRKLLKALGKTLLPELIESLREKRPIFAGPILSDFQILIAKWIMFNEIGKDADLAETFRAYRDVVEHPERHERKLKELEEAAAEID